jgi:phytoene synthase
MPATSDFASFEQEWLDAHPEYAIASIFLPPDQRRRANAFASLTHELGGAARLREPQVAAAKLSWWRDELASAAAGRGNHPIAKALFADEVARAVDAALWPALADAALKQLGMPEASTLPELLDQRAAFHTALARIDDAMSGGSAAGIAANATLRSVAELLREAAQIGHRDDSLPLPLDLLARHGLTRSSLSAPTPQRAALLRDHLDALADVVARNVTVPSRRGLYQRVRIRLDRSLMLAARNAADPLAFLDTYRAGRWNSLWVAWREARAQAMER